MRWRYYFQVIVSGTLLNLYYYTGLFDKTGAVLQAKTCHLRAMDTLTFSSKLDQTYHTFSDSLLGDNGNERRALLLEHRAFLSASQRLNITHATVDSDASARIRNYTHQPEGTRSQQTSLSSKPLERYAYERLATLGQTTVSLFADLMSYR